MKKKSSQDKLRGGYYTPQPIAHFLTKWAITSPQDKVLEPSCGDGNILEEAIYRLHELESKSTVTGVELFEAESKKARTRAKSASSSVKHEIHTGSFFDFAENWLESGRSFDAIVGNPPFVRFQDFPEDQREVAFSLMARLGLKPSRLSNIWLPFIAICLPLLSSSGRMALVIPAEILQVGYAAEVRKLLSHFFPRIDIFTFRELVFPDIQQEVVLILADKRKTRSPGIRVHELDNADSLKDIDVRKPFRGEIKPIDHSSEKWTKYFLDKDEIKLIRELKERSDISILLDHIDIDVGVVTGANDFFMLSHDEVINSNLSNDSIPVVGRSAALAGIIFDENDFEAWENSGKKSHLFYPKTPLSKPARKLIAQGESEGVHTGYKCRIRKQWYVVPSTWKPDFFFLRQADLSPRLVANQTNAICTDTLHRGRLISEIDPSLLAAAFNNSLTFAFSEVLGRSYGGGVMTFEPSEVEKLPLPVKGIHALDVAEIDRLIRLKETAAALDLVDRALLIKGLGLSQSQVASLRAIWMKLRDRRRGRKR